MGHRVRLYDPTAFAPGRTLLGNGGFEAGTAGWTTKNVTISRDKNNAVEGVASLRVSGHTSFGEKLSATFVRGPGFNVQKGKRYTIAFAVKASSVREIQVAVAGQGATYLVPEQWTRIVRSFTAKETGVATPKFNLGREDTRVWLDAVYIFEGEANVFFRDFENGAVVVNATPSVQTVDIGGVYQRIQGTGQDPINDGSVVTKVTLPPYDAAILVRPDGGSTGSSIGSCGAPTYDSATGPRAVCLGRPLCARNLAGASNCRGRTQEYSGSIVANAQFGNVSGYSLEGNDTLDLSDPSIIDFNLILSVSKGEDGFDFQMPAQGDVCLSLVGPQGVPVLVGEAATPINALSLNLRTLAPCGARLSHGKPQYDAGEMKATLLWEDADSGMWHLRVLGGSSATTLRYAGTLTGSNVTSTKKVSFEPNDVLSLKSNGISYDLKASRRGEDGIDFMVQPGTEPCLDVSGSPGQLLLGESMTPAAGRLNLATLQNWDHDAKHL